MSFKYVFFISFFLFILLPVDICPLSPEKDINSFIYNCYDSSSGMPQNSAKYFSQNSKGFVYVATQEGIIKYDGHSMDIFDISNLGGLPSSNTHTVLTMNDDSVYISTNKGLVHYTKNAEIISNFREIPFIKGSDINSISVSEDNGAIYGSISDKGVFGIKQGGKSFFLSLNNELKELKSINKVFLATDGTLYIASRTGLYKLTEEILEKTNVSGDNIRDISQGSDGTLWAVGYATLYRIDKTGSVKRYTSSEGMFLENISSVMVDSKNTVWIGSGTLGIARLWGKEFHYMDERNAHRLKNVTSFFEDKENNIWIGSETLGFCIVKEGIVKNTLLRDRMTVNVSGDARGNIWTNVNGYGAAKISPEQEVTFHTKNLGRYLLSVFGDSHGRVWVSSRSEGVMVSQNGIDFLPAAKLFRNKSNTIPFNTSVFFEDSRKTVWFNGRDNPSTVFFIRGEDLSSYELPAQNARVVDIKQNSKGEIIVGTRKNGIFKLDSVTGKFEKLSFFPENLFVHNMTVDSKDRLWVSTHSDGLLIYVRGDTLVLNTEKGLFDQSIHDVVEDKDGNFWFTTNKGLFKIERTGIESYINGDSTAVSSTVYNESDGMPSRECNGGVHPSVFKSPEGLLFIPTIKGIITIDPSESSVKRDHPPLSILWIIVDNDHNNRIRYIDGKPVDVPSGTESVEIMFSAPSFSNPGKVRFDYRLNNLLSTKKTTRRFVIFNNLDPGKHKFVIRAYYDGAAPDSFSEKEFLFTITPYFYQTAEFKTSSMVAAFLFFILIVLMRKRATLAREEEMLRIINEKTYELQLKNNELEEVVMVDALTGLKNRRYLFEIEEPNVDSFISSKERLVHLTESRDPALKSNLVYSLIMLDIDHFKQINDHFGHNTGDLILIDFGKLLQETVRREDVVIRWGGEEFLIVLKNVKKEKISQIAEKIRKAIEKYPFRTENGQTIWLTTSLGISIVPFYPQAPNLMSFESVLSITDLALYNSKNKGRDTCTMVSPGSRIPSTQEHLHGMLASSQYADLSNFYSFERIKPDNFGEYDI